MGSVKDNSIGGGKRMSERKGRNETEAAGEEKRGREQE